eukprot:Blabericola_migrator_1__3127@NODE_1911_length_3574_cov_59_627317_g1222_i0_p1_GENE_NODE_1911_length_3574_cov_59_627317_g1222_i0NODE_1911_length_3574_cov_59_627317_g1222_i0_p1_ORF_typecomplete_len1016_score221_78TF_Zn_Ribbon/PF08271_12/0_0018Ribosomal_L37ae/PF01780_19/0_01Desulfoferrod_N/PF06397_12/0_13zfRRN7/PF11781_8/0_59_NODE_1911_length_3574_cov_59_627317_g1222_i04673514
MVICTFCGSRQIQKDAAGFYSCKVCGTVVEGLRQTERETEDFLFEYTGSHTGEGMGLGRVSRILRTQEDVVNVTREYVDDWAVIDRVHGRAEGPTEADCLLAIQTLLREEAELWIQSFQLPDGAPFLAAVRDIWFQLLRLYKDTGLPAFGYYADSRKRHLKVHPARLEGLYVKPSPLNSDGFFGVPETTVSTDVSHITVAAYKEVISLMGTDKLEYVAKMVQTTPKASWRPGKRKRAEAVEALAEYKGINMDGKCVGVADGEATQDIELGATQGVETAPTEPELGATQNMGDEDIDRLALLGATQTMDEEMSEQGSQDEDAKLSEKSQQRVAGHWGAIPKRTAHDRNRFPPYLGLKTRILVPADDTHPKVLMSPWTSPDGRAELQRNPTRVPLVVLQKEMRKRGMTTGAYGLGKSVYGYSERAHAMVHAIYDHDFVRLLLKAELELLYRDFPDIEKLNARAPLVLQGLFNDNEETDIGPTMATHFNRSLNQTLQERQPIDKAGWQQTMKELIGIYDLMSAYTGYLFSLNSDEDLMLRELDESDDEDIPNHTPDHTPDNTSSASFTPMTFEDDLLSPVETTASRRYLSLLKRHRLVQNRLNLQSLFKDIQLSVGSGGPLKMILNTIKTDLMETNVDVKWQQPALPLPWCTHLELVHKHDTLCLPKTRFVMKQRFQRSKIVKDVVASLTGTSAIPPVALVDMPLDTRAVLPICLLALKSLDQGFVPQDTVRLTYASRLYEGAKVHSSVPRWLHQALFRIRNRPRTSSANSKKRIQTETSLLALKVPKAHHAIDKAAMDYASVLGMEVGLNVKQLTARILRLIDIDPQYYTPTVVLSQKIKLDPELVPNDIVLSIALVLAVCRLYIPSFREAGYPVHLSDEASFHSLIAEWEATRADPVLTATSLEELLSYKNFRLRDPRSQQEVLQAFETFTRHTGEVSRWRELDSDIVHKMGYMRLTFFKGSVPKKARNRHWSQACQCLQIYPLPADDWVSESSHYAPFDREMSHNLHTSHTCISS